MNMNMNYSALTRTISKSDIEQLRTIPEYARTFWSSNLAGALYGGVGMTAIFIAPLVTLISEREVSVLVIVRYVIAIIISAGIGALIVRYIRRRTDLRLYRFVYFAKENNFQYQQKHSTGGQPGLIFHEGHSRIFRDVISGAANDTPFEMGNYFYVTGSGKNQQSHDWGYMVIPLKRHVPNMILDAKSNNMSMFGIEMTNLPSAFKNNQTLSLEGDFDNYFTLYAPKEYKRDALYIFTPDLMALLIDNTATFDVETVDDKLYIYSSQQLNLLNPLLLEKLFQIITTVGVKTISQTASYADERVIESAQGSIIAEPGRRLKPSYTKTIVIIAGIAILYFLLIVF
jgi:hypothetical protein